MGSIGSIYGNSMGMMEKSLDYLWAKQGITSANLANVDTPGYKAKYLSFEDTFRNKLEAASIKGSKAQVGRAITSTEPTVRESQTQTARLDGNNVNADVEMVELTKTALQYQYELNSVNSDIARLRSAIKGQ